MDLVAVALGMEPAAVRFVNLIKPHQMPYPVGLPYRDGHPIVYDSGDYVCALEQAIAAIGGVESFRQTQRQAAADGRLVGLGLGCYTEGTGVGPFEAAQVRIDKTGSIVVSVGACAQGQGHETVFAQVAADCWNVAPSAVVVRAGDTSAVVSGYGTVGSRSTVTASMALKRASDALARKVLALAGELLEAAVADLELRNGGVAIRGAPGLYVSLAEVAAAAAPGWQHHRPDGMSPELVETHYYEPPTVTWSYAANAAVVEVDRDTGVVRVMHYVEVHDAGVLVNPMLADGQIAGGIAQGLGGALYEAIVYDAAGQLISGSLMDYALPRATDMPPLTIAHIQTPSTLNPLGFKGLGEGGAIAPPVVIANAVGDALRDSGHEFNHLPLHPETVLAAIRDT
jgi:carbon-monoxide dehydrogenase large subunit